MSDTAPAIVWFRNDLRLADHPALGEAVTSGRPILPLYIFEAEGRPLGGAARWWLAGSLGALAQALAAHGAPLLLPRGKAADVLPDLARETGAAAVHWNRPAEAMAAARDTAVAGALRQGGIGALQQAGDPPAPLPAPARIRPYAPALASDALADWRLRPTMPDWATGLAVARQPGAAAA